MQSLQIHTNITWTFIDTEWIFVMRKNTFFLMKQIFNKHTDKSMLY